MLFNKTLTNATAIRELKTFIGFLFSSTSFSDIEMDIILSEEEIQKTIGEEIYTLADNHYNSNRFGPGATFKTADETLLDSLVAHIQLPVALMAYHSYSATNDVSHEKTGRKLKIDSDNEKIPFEWMLIRDEEAILNKAYKTTDRLIAFLDKQLKTDPVNAIGETWGGSTAYKLSKEALISSAELFDSIFPIEKSRRFYITILPFILENQRKIIGATITPEILSGLKEKILDEDELTDADVKLIELIRPPLALYSMATAVQRLAINIMPNGIFQEYFSNKFTAKVKHEFDLSVRRELIASLRDDAKQEMKHLEQHLAKLAKEAIDEDYEAPEQLRIDPDTKFVRL